EVDVRDIEELRRVLRRHVERVGADLRKQGRRARTVSLKVRWPDFTTLSRSHTSERPIQSTAAILEVARALLDEVMRTEGPRPVRLLGVAVTNLVDDEMQLALDDLDLRRAGTPRILRDEGLDRTIDDLRSRYGDGSVTRGL
ncbi:MAG: DNA polymerase IV, partial [Dehalococcoidia bacterium]